MKNLQETTMIIDDHKKNTQEIQHTKSHQILNKGPVRVWKA